MDPVSSTIQQDEALILPDSHRTDPARAIIALQRHKIHELEQQLSSANETAAPDEQSQDPVMSRLEPSYPGMDCAVCAGLLWSSSTLANCGHTFCDKCIAELFRVRLLACPVCRSTIRRRPIKVIAFLELMRGLTANPTSISSTAPPVWAEAWDSLLTEVTQREGTGGQETRNVLALAQELDRILNTGSTASPPLYLRVERENGRFAIRRLPPPERRSIAIR